MLPPASSQTSLDIRDVLIAKAHRIRALVPAPLARGRSTAAVAFALGFFLGGGDLRLRLDGAWSDSATTTLKLSQERGEVFRLRDKLSWRARFHDHF